METTSVLPKTVGAMFDCWRVASITTTKVDIGIDIYLYIYRHKYTENTCYLMLFKGTSKQANAPVPQVSFAFAVSQNGRATP